MGCSCSTQQALRFKNLVVAVYPRTDDGDFNKDAMGKLRSYVASNLDRIPRVCRKVTKLVFADVEKHDVKRVTVGAHILRDLVDSATEFESFVPCCISVALKLFAEPEAEFRIAAADIVSVVSMKVQERSHTDSARRLLADSQNDLLRSLKGLMEDGIGTNDIIALHCRYAGLVAVGNLADCFTGTQLVADQLVLELIPSVLMNLHQLAKSAEPTSAGGARRRTAPIVTAVWVQPEPGPIATVTPPLEADHKDAAFVRASIRAVAGLAGCCTSIGALPKLLSIVTSFANGYNAWSTATLCVSVFHTITLALQRRPQQLGYSVVQFLVDEAHNCTDDEQQRHRALLECIASCVEVIPLTSSRPHAIFEAVRSVITNPSCGEDNAQEVCVSAALLTRTLAERTSLQRNWAQLSRMIAEMLLLLPKTHQKVLLCAQLKVLSCLLRHISHLTDDDRQRLGVVEAIQPYLHAADDMRAYAARCLGALVASSVITTAATAPLPVRGPSTTATSRAVADDIDSAQTWLQNASRSNEHSAFSIVEMGHVAAALIFSQRARSLPFILAWVMDLQQRNAQSRSELSRAWLHLTLAVLHAAADMLSSAPLTSYVVDLITRRGNAEPSELPHCFSQRLAKPSCERCGLSVARGHDPQAPLTSSDESNSSLSTTFITLSTLVVYVLRTPDPASVLEAFSCVDGDAVEETLKQRVKEFGESSQAVSSSGSSHSRRALRKPTDSPSAVNLARGAGGPISKGDTSSIPATRESVQFLAEPLTQLEKEATFAEVAGDIVEQHSAHTLLTRFNEIYGVVASEKKALTAAPLLSPWNGYESFADPNADLDALSGPSSLVQLDNTSFTVPLAQARRQKGTFNVALPSPPLRSSDWPQAALSILDTI